MYHWVQAPGLSSGTSSRCIIIRQAYQLHVSCLVYILCTALLLCSFNMYTVLMVVPVDLHVQCQSWPILLQGYDMVGIAQVSHTTQMTYFSLCSCLNSLILVSLNAHVDWHWENACFPTTCPHPHRWTRHVSHYSIIHACMYLHVHVHCIYLSRTCACFICIHVRQAKYLEVSQDTCTYRSSFRGHACRL